MENQKKAILVFGVVMVLGATVIGIEYNSLYQEHVILEQQYQWAMELAKMNLQEREKTIEQIHGLPVNDMI